jgi:hypothetical protein
MQIHQHHLSFQPYFRIHEQNREDAANHKVIDPEVIEKMSTQGDFDMGELDIRVSDKHGGTTIALGLLDISEREEIVPISGFPRNLVLHSSQTGSLSLRTAIAEYSDTRIVHQPGPSKVSPRIGVRRRRNPSNTPSERVTEEWPEEDRPLSLFDLSSEHSQASSQRPTPLWQLPERTHDTADWIQRRTAASIFPPGATSALASSAESSSTALPVVLEVPGVALTPVSTSTPAPAPVAAPTPPDEALSDRDEDEEQLERAIEISFGTSNRYTANGTNLEELAYALELSEVVQ